jgi:FkbM family methyltransferase
MSRSVPAIDRVHRFLSRSSLATRAALAIRNQCRAIIKHRLMTTHEVEESGELWLAERVAPNCRTFIDVGANRGEWTAMMLRYAPADVRAVLFEPGAAAAARLRERFRHRDGIDVVQRALSDRPASAVPFFEEPGAGNTSSLSRGASTAQAQETTVDVTTLDAAAERLSLARIDLLKVDAEGHDLAVLRGAERLLRENRVGILQWEYGDAWIPGGFTLGAALDYVSSFGYETLLLKRGGLHRFDYSLFGEYFTFSNFVSVRGGDRAALAPVVHDLL